MDEKQNIIERLWLALDHKGRFATIIGMIFCLPVNVRFLFDFFGGEWYTREQMEVVIFVNIIAMIWLILPSTFSIKGSNFEMMIKD